jgi:CBS domain-containing protein
MKVKDCMCNQVWAAKPETTIYDIAKLMETNKIGCVPICDNNNSMVGIVTDRDIVLRGVVCNKNTKTTPVSEIMSTNICYCNPNDDVYDAECKMSQNQVRRIPVLENNQIVGILTLGDLAHNNKEIGKQEVCNTISNICENNGQPQNGC